MAPAEPDGYILITSVTSTFCYSVYIKEVIWSPQDFTMILGYTTFKYIIVTPTDAPTEVFAPFVGIFGPLKIPEKMRLKLSHEFTQVTKSPGCIRTLKQINMAFDRVSPKAWKGRLLSVTKSMRRRLYDKLRRIQIPFKPPDKI